MALDIANPGAQREDLANALKAYTAPAKTVPVTGDTDYSPAAHLGAILCLAPAAGEVVITVPTDAPDGHSFRVYSPADAYPRFVVGEAGAPEHPNGDTRGLPQSVVSVLVINPTGSAAIAVLSGATQP